MEAKKIMICAKSHPSLVPHSDTLWVPMPWGSGFHAVGALATVQGLLEGAAAAVCAAILQND